MVGRQAAGCKIWGGQGAGSCCPVTALKGGMNLR